MLKINSIGLQESESDQKFRLRLHPKTSDSATLQVTLAYESIVLYMCEGKVLMDKLHLIPDCNF